MPERQELARPGYRSLAELIEEEILSGALPVGAQLPTHRDLAHHMGLSVQTVSRSYELLIRKGLIEGQIGRGTYVRTARPDPTAPYYRQANAGDIVDLSMLTPWLSQEHHAAFRQLLLDFSRWGDLETTASFRTERSFLSFRPVFARWLSRPGAKVDPDLLIPTNGASPALTLALQSLQTDGERAATLLAETATLHVLRPLCAYLGWKLQAVETDEAGMVPEALRARLERGAARAAFLLPNGAGPQATMMPEARRREIAAIAKLHDLRLIIGDALGLLKETLPTPFMALAPEQTLTIVSVTKPLTPALRIGGLIVPHRMRQQATNQNYVTNWMATPLVAAMLERWITTGIADHLIALQREEMRKRNAAFEETFGGRESNVISPDPGEVTLHRWISLSGREEESRVIGAALDAGVALASGGTFAPHDGPRPFGIRLCFGGADFERYLIGLQRLRPIFGADREG